MHILDANEASVSGLPNVHPPMLRSTVQYSNAKISILVSGLLTSMKENKQRPARLRPQVRRGSERAETSTLRWQIVILDLSHFERGRAPRKGWQVPQTGAPRDGAVDRRYVLKMGVMVFDVFRIDFWEDGWVERLRWRFGLGHHVLVVLVVWRTVVVVTSTMYLHLHPRHINHRYQPFIILSVYVRK